MTTNTIITDDSLQLIFTGKRMNAKFQYEVILQSESVRSQLTFKTIWANSKAEATRLGNEYGYRFLDAKVILVTRVSN